MQTTPGSEAVARQTPLAAARTDEILDSIRAVFMRRGFEGASMQSLARAAGMSAGNFYLYFASKAAIIEAMVERDLSAVRADFDSVHDAPRPRERLRELVRERVAAHSGCPEPMMAEIEAAALRNPEIAVVLRRFRAAIEANLATLLAGLAGAPGQAGSAHFVVHARTMMLLVRGMMTERRLANDSDGPRNEALAAHLVELIDRMIDEAIAPHTASMKGG